MPEPIERPQDKDREALSDDRRTPVGVLTGAGPHLPAGLRATGGGLVAGAARRVDTGRDTEQW
jgi:hypothetical protein